MAYAAGSTKIDVYFKNLRYMFDGVEKQQTGSKGFIYEGTTYVPLRFIAESLGKEVSWQGDTETIWIGQQPVQPTNSTSAADRKEIPLTSLKATKQDEASLLAIDSWSTRGHNTAVTKDFQINKTSYSTGLGLYLHDRPYPPNVRTGGSAQYTLSGKYSRLTGLVGAADSSLKSTATGNMTIIGDGKELAVVTGIRTGESPKPVEVDVTGIQSLRIQFNSDRQGLINMLFINPELTAAASTAVAASPVTAASDVQLVSRNRTAEFVAIVNRGASPVDLKGWRVESTDGQESFTFQQSFLLGAGSYVFLTSGSDGALGRRSDFQDYARTIVWSAEPIWSDSAEDEAQLYNAEGALVSVYK
ncbi:lamin tail domain-containing protein [Paenibacillus sp. YYML68]|uniref:lamin tail domain-containing protein n=1 Tax=Paenibacillus sp. YYML68 TaxID=2909250 RepID=UPI0024916ABB|nr:lamin tail domain-containing protein [Paenibacillus sp. YYML68]